MRINTIIAGLLMAGTAASALASAPLEGVTDNSLISKVDTVYVREANGLYIEKKLLRRTENKELWVTVRFAASLPGAPASELFQVPADIAIERGDLVTTRNGDPAPREMNLLPEVNRVTRLVAKHDTLMAMAFGLSNSRRMPELYVAAPTRSNMTRVTFASAYSR